MTARSEGERRRDDALLWAAQKCPSDGLSARIAMLEAALEREDHTFSSDDATPSGVEYSDNAAWLGAAVRCLASKAWVVPDGHVRSTRPSRKSNFVRSWRVTDAALARAELERLRLYRRLAMHS